MNSVIISSVFAFCRKIWGLFKDSGVYQASDRVYNAFSLWWRDSCIINFVKRERKTDSKRSLFYRLVRLPFAIFETVGKRLGKWLNEQLENSIILNGFRDFMNNLLALNTRFVGVMLAFTFLSYAVVSKEPVFATGIVVGLLLSLINYNITDCIPKSRFVGFCEKTIGFEGLSWEIYKNNNIAKPHILVVSAIVGAVCGALLKSSPILAVALPVGITGMTAVCCYPIVGVFAAVAAAPFVPTMLLALLCLITFATQLIKSLTEGGFKWKVDGVGIGLGFLLFFLLISSMLSFNITKSMMVWAMYLVFIGFYFVIINTVKTKEQLIALLKVFAIMGLLVSIYGILQYIFGWNTNNAWIDEEMFEEATMRVYSTMENPNVLGEYLLLLIPVSAIFALRKDAKPLERCLYLVVLAAGGVCMLLTQSRGCWLGLILAAAVFITFYNGKLWGLLPLVLLLLPLVMPETMVDRMMSVGNMEDSSTSYRVFIWRGSFEMLRDFWVGGIGMGEGAFRSVYPLYSFNGIIAPHSHNTYLQLWVEAGIIAPVIFVVIMAVILKKLAKAYKNSNTDDRLVPLAIGSGILGFMLQSMFDYTFYNYRMMAMFFMLIAIGSAFSEHKEGDSICIK